MFYASLGKKISDIWPQIIMTPTEDELYVFRDCVFLNRREVENPIYPGRFPVGSTIFFLFVDC